MSTVEIILTAVTVLVGAGGIGTVVAARVFPERESKSKQRGDRVTELERAGEQYRQELADCRHDMRRLSDYVHDLRDHIANRNPPPPPDFPEGLRL